MSFLLSLLEMLVRVFNKHPLGTLIVAVFLVIIFGWAAMEFFYRMEGRLHDIAFWMMIGIIIMLVVFFIVRTIFLVPEVI